jgi:hypothetical protein
VPHILVMADRETDQGGDGTIMLRERINASDLESTHFGARLLERLGWAVGDAHDVELDAGPTTRGRITSARRPGASAAHNTQPSASVVTTAS